MKKVDTNIGPRSLRIKEGIARARSITGKWGRPTIIETSGDSKLPLNATEMRSQGFSWSQIASNLGVGRTTARRLVSLCQKDVDNQKKARLLNQQNGG